MSGQAVRAGVIGYGNMGTSHAKNIYEGKVPGMILGALCDIDGGKLERAKGDLPGVALFAEAKEMMESGTIDAVVIAVPHYDHPPLAEAAFERGLHVMCEKPAGVYTKQVRLLNERAASCPLVFGMMFNQRTNGVYKKMREFLQDGGMGNIKRVSWIITTWYRSQAYYDSGGWRATWEGEGGGVLLNQCPHNLDLLYWICGLPSRVMAHCHEGKWHDIEVEDDVTAYLEFPDGATGVFVTSTADAPGTDRFEVALDGGTVVCENGKTLRAWRNKVPEREHCFATREGFVPPECEEIMIDIPPENPQHIGVLAAFADAILNGGPLVAEGREGINGLMISNAMHLSSWLGRAVELPVDEELFLSELNKKITKARKSKGKESS